MDWASVWDGLPKPTIRRVRVFVLNNYDLERVGAEVARGEKPSHHLFGIDAFRRAGWQVELAPSSREARGGGSISLGRLRRQRAAWRQRHVCDVVYAPCQTETQILSYLRALGLFRVPVVTLAHHPPAGGRLRWLRAPFLRLQVRGTDRFPAISATVAVQFRALASRANAADYAPVLCWGPDLAYYDRFRVAGPGERAVAAGRTGRDWQTFVRAAGQARIPTRVVCLENDAGLNLADVGPECEVITARSEAALLYPNLLPRLATARVHAIPLASTTTLAGLTSLTDALGLGKPVIMTRHPLIDLDIEREGIGRWVGVGDIADWAAALRWFDEHPAEAAQMGERARALAEAKWNSALFGRQMMDILEAAVGDPPR